MALLNDAKAIGNLTGALDLLIQLETFTEAEALLIDRSDQLANCYYDSLTKHAKKFEQADKPLAALLCYRTLLEDILNHGRSKAYRHAARYYNKLKALDKKLDGYQQFPDATHYHAALKKQHGRKRAFWSLIEST